MVVVDRVALVVDRVALVVDPAVVLVDPGVAPVVVHLMDHVELLYPAVSLFVDVAAPVGHAVVHAVASVVRAAETRPVLIRLIANTVRPRRANELIMIAQHTLVTSIMPCVV